MVQLIQILEQRGDISSVLECVWQLYRYEQHTGVWQTQPTVFTEWADRRGESQITRARLSLLPITCQEHIFRELQPHTHTHTVPTITGSSINTDPVNASTNSTLAICMSVPIWKLRNDETIVSKRMKKRDALINLQVKMWEQRGSDQEGFHHVRSYRKQTCQITPKNHQKSPGQTQGWSL